MEKVESTLVVVSETPGAKVSGGILERAAFAKGDGWKQAG